MPDKFTIDINNFVQIAKENMDEFSIEFSQDIKKAVIEATPVLTGNLRRGWYDVWTDKVYSLINGVEYGPYLEFGTVKMLPRAFVRGTIDRADIIAKETLARIVASKS
jgi:hypothetical protein